MIIRIRSSILGKLSTSDVVIFSSWCSVVSPDKKGPSIQVGDSPLNYVFFQSWVWVMRHLILIQK